MQKISVIVPVYNLENEILRCVASIQAQTYENIEIILVDDGSCDKSAEIIRNLAKTDPRICPVFKENGGVTSARLEGIRHATGEYIGFVDGDDEIEPDMYEFLLHNAMEYNADISHCGYQMIFPDGHVNYFYNTGCILEQNRIQGLQNLLDGSIIEPGLWNKIFHKTLFYRLLNDDVIDMSIKINEDMLMNYYLFSATEKSIYEDKCPYHYLVRYSSASRQKLNINRIYDPIKVKRIILDDVSQELLEDAQRAYILACINTYNILILNDGGKYKAEKNNIRKLIIRNWKCTVLIKKRTRILARLIRYIPWGYPLIYKIYSRYFQKQKYN